jgi:hypothetical protein
MCRQPRQIDTHTRTYIHPDTQKRRRVSAGLTAAPLARFFAGIAHLRRLLTTMHHEYRYYRRIR